MHPLLSKLLHRRDIKDVTELSNAPLPDGSPSERQMFENYREILSKDELTIQDVRNFCAVQIEVIETKWKDLNLRQEQKAEWLPYFTVYRSLLLALDSPKMVRQNLEKYLTDLIK